MINKIVFPLFFCGFGFSMTLFYAPWDDNADAKVGPSAKLFDSTIISKTEFQRGNGSLHLNRQNVTEKTGILFDETELNASEGTIDFYCKTSSLKDAVLFNFKSDDGSCTIWVSDGGGKYIVVDFANPNGKQKRIFANLDKGGWKIDSWNRLTFLWKMAPGNDNDTIEVLVNSISAGRRDDVELWSGKCSGKVKGKLSIGINVAQNSGGNCNAYFDEFTITDEASHNIAGKGDAMKHDVVRFAKIPGGLNDPNLANIAPYASIRSAPYAGYQLKSLVDGEVGCRNDDGTLIGDVPLFAPWLGMNVPIRFDYFWDTSVTIERIRFYQLQGTWEGYAREYLIEADIDGDGKFENIIVDGKDGRVEEWVDLSFAPVQVRAIRFQGTKGEKGRSGMRNYPLLGEFEIYTSKKNLSQFPQAKQTRDIPQLKNTEVIQAWPSINERKWNEGLMRGIYMISAALWDGTMTPDVFKKSETYKKMLSWSKKMGVNNMTVYTHFYASEPIKKTLTVPEQPYASYTSSRQATWPSKVVPGLQFDLLKEMSDAFAKENIGLISSFQPAPFGKSSWDFPRVQNLKDFPCIISSAFFRDTSDTLYNELAGSSPGVVLGGDEYFVTGHPLPVPTNDPCIAAFKERFGFDSPPVRIDDSEKSRKWIIFQYEQLAKLFASWNVSAKKRNPAVVNTTLLTSGDYLSMRYDWIVSLDTIGAMSGIDALGCDPYWEVNAAMGHFFPAELMKKYTAASPQRQAFLVLEDVPFLYNNGVQSIGTFTDSLMISGPALSGLMHGSVNVQYYRGDYLYDPKTFADNPQAETVRDVFSIMKILDAYDFRSSSIPKDVALLYSRAGEDWWQLANLSGTNTSAIQFEGWDYHRSVMEVLLRRAFPFELFYLDRPDRMAEIASYRALIIPFGYAMSKTTFSILEKAIAKGVKVIALRCKGERDEFGESYSNPLMVEYINDGKIQYLDWDITAMSYADFEKKLAGVIDSALGINSTLQCNNYGNDVEVAVRVAPGGEYFILIINWEKTSSPVDLCLRMPAGKYSIHQVTATGKRQSIINGKTELSHTAFATFRNNAPARTAQLFVIEQTR